MPYPLIQPMAFRLDGLTSQPDAWPDELRAAYAMRFPPEWREILAPLAMRTPRGGDRAYDTLPIHTLNAAIRALMPDIITVTRGQHMRNPAGAWLLSRVPISPQAIRRMVVAWARSAAFGENEEERRLQAAQQLLPSALVWEPCDLGATPWTTSPAGTALPSAGSVADPFRLLPELLAARVALQLTTKGRRFRFGGELVELRRATLPNDAAGVELISWPPAWGQYRGKSWPFSFVITITLQTAPFEGAPLLYADLSVRRWAAGSLHARNATVYLATEAPWIEDAPATPYFGVARITRTRNANNEWGWEWENALPSILDQLNQLSVTMPSFPSAAAIAERPEVALEFQSGELAGAGAAIMYHSGMKNDHGVGTGFLPDDRASLIADQLASALAPYCPLVDPLPRLAVRMMPRPVNAGAQDASHGAGPARPEAPDTLASREVNGDDKNGEDDLSADAGDASVDEPFLEDETGAGKGVNARSVLDERLMGLAMRHPTEQEMTQIAAAFGVRALDSTEQRQWRSAVACAGDHTGILLACQSGVTQLALVTALRTRLGPETQHDSSPASGVAETHGLRVGRLRWVTPEGAFTVLLCPLGELGSELFLGGHGGVLERRRAANETRADSARAYMRALKFGDDSVAAGLVGAIIELQSKEAFARHADPKQALRLGCAHAGAVTQFITAYSSSDEARAGSLGHRAGGAVADLLRQFGVQPHPPSAPLQYRAEAGWTPFPSRPALRYIAVWLVSKNAKSTMQSGPIVIPVVVVMEATGHQIFGYAPGFDHPLPYPAALTKLATDLREANPRVAPRGDGGVARFLEDTLRLWSGPEALVLARAQNLRSHWPWLKNGNLLLDQVMWGAARAPISDWPGVRIVRVRDLDSHETPEWFAVANQASRSGGSTNSPTRRGFSAGLWRMTGVSGGVATGASDRTLDGQADGIVPSSAAAARLYASTGPKSSTQRVRLARSRMNEGNQQFMAANPSLLELAVAAIQPGDTALEWAAHTHALRMAASHWSEHGDALRFPLPLQLAQLMGEYALVLADDDSDEPDDDSDAM